MRFSVERLRVGLLVGAGLLVAVIAGFLEFAHYKAHRIIADLPKRLGATIIRETNNYSYSQSYQGKTVFTLHAGKGVEHKDGKMQLHDVDLTMYGRKGDRADHISGADFEYDEKAQVVRALGLVHLDLQAPPAEEAVALGVVPGKGAAANPKPGPKAGAPDRVVHITTSGLVYQQKLGLATTDQEIEFTDGGLAGKALGAQYNSATGGVVLQSAVTMHGVEHGQAVLLTANHGEFDRQAELATLQHARYSSGGETAEAEVGVIHLRADGSAERIEGEQHVRLERADEGVVTADRGDLTLNPESKPTLAVLTGTVRYADDEPLRQGNGSAAKATLHFDGQGRVEHVLLNGGAGRAADRVESTERVRTAAGAAWSQRDLSAETVELALAAGAAGAAGSSGAAGGMELREATAVGGARLNSVAAVGGGWSRLSGDRLEAKFVAPRGQTEVSTVHGVGHTVLDQMGTKGIEQVSAGDALTVNFRELKKTAGARENGAVEVATAAQDGHVVITRTVPAGAASVASGSGKAGFDKSKVSGPEVQHARADRASFDQDSDLVTLAGSAELWDAASRVSANKVVMEQGSGDATADGAVRVTYQQVSGSQGSGLQASGQQASGQQMGATTESQPTHILAERAELLHDAGRATFYGAGSGAGGMKLARLWQSGADGQGGSQVEAPVLILEQGSGQGHGRLTARGVGAGAPMAVRTVLVSAAGKGRAATTGSGVAGAAGLARNTAGAAEQGKAVPVQGQVQGQAQGQVQAQGQKQGQGAKRSGRAGSNAGLPGSGETQVVRVTSREMVYSEETRQAEFSGGVRVLDADGDLRAQQATVFLQAASSGAGKSGVDGARTGGNSGSAANGVGKAGGASGVGGLTSGGVERVVATGQVDMTEPGRHATGDRLVYTASDQMFVLTGTVANPPKVVDAEQGTATGASLRFHAGDDAVVISGEGGAAGQKVRTQTKVN